MNIELKSSLREVKTNLNSIRNKGFVPAVLYGHNVDNVSLSVSHKDFEKIYKEFGKSTVVNLSIGGEDIRSVLVHDVQYDYLKERITHIDFYQVKTSEKISSDIEIVFVGESPAVKNLGGYLVKSIEKIEVEALPNDLPRSIEVDLSKLENFDSNIRIEDLLSSIDTNKVKVKLSSGTVIASVVPPREEDSEIDNEDINLDSVKVEGEEKKSQKENEGGQDA